MFPVPIKIHLSVFLPVLNFPPKFPVSKSYSPFPYEIPPRSGSLDIACIIVVVAEIPPISATVVRL